MLTFSVNWFNINYVKELFYTEVAAYYETINGR